MDGRLGSREQKAEFQKSRNNRGCAGVVHRGRGVHDDAGRLANYEQRVVFIQYGKREGSGAGDGAVTCGKGKRHGYGMQSFSKHVAFGYHEGIVHRHHTIFNQLAHALP